MEIDYTETSLNIRLKILEAEHAVMTEFIEKLARETAGDTATHFIQSFQDALKKVRLDFLASMDNES